MLTLEIVKWEPLWINSLLLLLRNLDENPDFKSGRQFVRIRFTRDVALGVICVAMEFDIILSENIAKKKEVNNNKKKGDKDRAMRNTRAVRRG